MKKCIKCGLEKDESEFYVHKRHKDGLRSHCIECHKISVKTYRKSDKGKISQKAYYKKNPNKRREAQLICLYGINQKQYNEMFIEQNGVCAICKKPETYIHPRTGKIPNFCVDHDHITGKIRGLLCCSCNFGIGKFKDNPQTLRNGAIYLEKYKTQLGDLNG